MFKQKTLLITGGTGSFGHAVLKKIKQLLYSEYSKIENYDESNDNCRY